MLFSNIPPTSTNPTSSCSIIRTTSTTIILINNMRSTDLHPCIYSRHWLFQIRTAASGTEADSICLFRISLSCGVVQNIVPLLRIVTRVCLHRETMDFFLSKNHVIEEIVKFIFTIFIILSDSEESTNRFSDFYLFRFQR